MNLSHGSGSCSRRVRPCLATVIAERIGWTRGITILKERVAQLRPLYLPPKPYQRTDYEPGELAQWDLWQPPVDIPGRL